jgi:hypothetical protein
MSNEVDIKTGIYPVWSVYGDDCDCCELGIRHELIFAFRGKEFFTIPLGKRKEVA